MHVEIEFNEKDCAITSERLKKAHDKYIPDDDGRGTRRRGNPVLTAGEMNTLRHEQKIIRKTLNLSAMSAAAVSAVDVGESIKDGSSKVMNGSTATATADAGNDVSAGGGSIKAGGSSLRGKMKKFGKKVSDKVTRKKVGKTVMMQLPSLSEGIKEESEEESEEEDDELVAVQPPQDQFDGEKELATAVPWQKKNMRSRQTVKAQFMTAKLRAHLDLDDDGVLGTQSDSNRLSHGRNSIRGNNFMMYNKRMSVRGGMNSQDSDDEEDAVDKEVESKEIDVEDISYVRKPSLSHIVQEYEAMLNHPKYTLKQVVLSRRFHLYAHRFKNAQFQRTLVYPTLPQPPELYSCPWLTKSHKFCGECKEEEPVTEKQRTRSKGHRFIIAADTQFGILMDGFAMDRPNWSQEIEISRKCVAQINAMQGCKRPLYVCVCGDLVDTESSFSGAIASWKKVMNGWERNLVYEQQVKDFKRVWARLNPDIALVCLCGNHDVGNRPTKESINRWTSSFGDEFLSFWVNGTFNICLNNCLFSNPTGAPDLFAEQLQWMEEKLAYARENDATHIFVYGHFPWFLKDEEEADDYLTSFSAAPAGWGPPGARFSDSYFTVPYEQRKLAMVLFKKYDVTACFSGHFHQNVVAKSSWGMPMIVTGPLSMNLTSDIANELSNGETNGIGMRVVDVGERGEFTHRWTLLDDEKELYEHAMERCRRQSAATADDDDGEEITKTTTGKSVVGNLFSASSAGAMK